MICDKKMCTGCTACYNVCPVNAIDMEPSEEGFLYPRINSEKCINCNLCKKICPALKNNKSALNNEVYVAINKSNEQVLKSSSGGIFTILMENFIKNGNYVCGCIFDENLKAVHILTNDLKVASKMKKSKYVQSDLGNVYRQIKEILHSNKKKVLFVGTPCQVDGLKSYVSKDYENLYTVDIICHGVPSPKIFEEHKKYIENKYGKIYNIDFRTKSKNDINSQVLSYTLENKVIKIKNYELDPYYYAFYNALDFRECCYKCKYANCNRVGDITLGDFWGVEKYHENFTQNNGCSAIIVNNLKGKELFDNIIKDKVNYEKTDINKVKVKNNNLNQPAKRSDIRDKIYSEMNEKGYNNVIKTYLRPPRYILVKIKSYIPLKIKRRVAKLIKILQK